MTKSPEKADVTKKTTGQVKEETREKLDKVKADGVSELFQKLLKDFKSLSSKERMGRIGQIIFVATLGKFLPKKAKEAVEEASSEEKKGATSEKETPESNDTKEEGEETQEKADESIGDRLARIAKSFVGVVRDEFRTNDVRGGTLACAKVATTILKEAGLSDKILLGVSATAQKLKKEGWKKAKRPPRPGDVIIWAPTGGYFKDPEGISVSKGHRHIGIALNDKRCVSNSSSKKMPREHKIFTKRPVELILRAPTDLAA